MNQASALASPLASLPSSRLRHWAWALAGLLLGLICVAAVWLASALHHATAEEAEMRLVRFVLGAEAAANRSFASISSLLTVSDNLLALTHREEASRRERLSVAEVLESAMQQNAMVRTLSIVDAQGQVLVEAGHLSRDERQNRHFSPAWLRELAQRNGASEAESRVGLEPGPQGRRLYVGQSLHSYAAGRGWALVAEVPWVAMGAVLQQGGDLDGLEITLERGSGATLLSIPERTAGTPPPQALLATPSVRDSVSRTLARVSQAPALVAFHPLAYGDLWITASLPLVTVYRDWYRACIWLAGGVLLFALLLGAGGLLAQRHLRRLQAVQRQVGQAQATLDQALDSMVSGFLLLDSARRVVQWNHRYAEMFPWQSGALAVGAAWDSLFQADAAAGRGAGAEVADAAQGPRDECAQRQLLDHPAQTLEQKLPNGLWVQMSARAIREGGWVITCHDVTEMREASAAIENLAFYDPLTGLPNRRLLLDRLGQATMLAEREGWVGALLFLDLDQFKALNDTQGHEVGDLLLQQVALRLRSVLRTSDTVARLGGDEFVVMLSHLSSDRDEATDWARHVGEKILRQLSQPYGLGSYVHRSACSIGATLYGPQALPPIELLKQADIAMYQIKARNGHGLCFFDPEMQQKIQQRVDLEADLRVALAHRQFSLHYQPQYTLQGEVLGAEALLRWRHPERGLVSPGEFIAVAEASEIIVPLGQWVIRAACEQLALWQRDPRLQQLQLAVNVSARQFRQADFVAQVMAVVQATGVRPHLLKLELTESLVIEDVQGAIAKMQLLRAQGVHFSMDDFGTGHSSLTYLTQLPLHQLKIDQSFVRHLGTQHTDGVIVQTIIGMARNLGLDVIAEGVETQAQKDLLAAYGCTLFQGYLFSPPLPIAAFNALLAASVVRA